MARLRWLINPIYHEQSAGEPHRSGRGNFNYVSYLIKLAIAAKRENPTEVLRSKKRVKERTRANAWLAELFIILSTRGIQN